MEQTQSITQSIALLQNVSLCNAAIVRAENRHEGLPGMVGFYGHSGLGKSTGATYVANRHNAVYIQCKSAWTKKAFMESLLKEMGVKPAKNIPDMVDQASEELALSDRPLIIDEFDFLVEKNMVEIVRDIYESSMCTIMIIGEEQLEAKLKKFERFHNRILEWVQAQPVNLAEAKILASLYAPDTKVHDDLLQIVVDLTRGVTRRVCTNLANINQFAKKQGYDEIDKSLWGTQDIYTGSAKIRRHLA